MPLFVLGRFCFYLTDVAVDYVSYWGRALAGRYVGLDKLATILSKDFSEVYRNYS